MKIKNLIEELKKLPQDKSIVCQLCPTEGGAYNMDFEFNDIPRSDWIVQLRISHPEFKKFSDLNPRTTP